MYQHFLGLQKIFLNILGALSEERLKYWWDRKEEFGEKLSRLLLGEPSAPVDGFKVWKTIKLGLHKSADAYRAALGKASSDWANDLMGKPAFTVAGKEKEIDLVVRSVAELGFPKGAARKDIYDKAESLGLELCPPEVGPALRLAYTDQPDGEWLLIGMEPIAGSGGYLEVFFVLHGGRDRRLDADYGYPDDVWDAVGRWVFVLPRK